MLLLTGRERMAFLKSLLATQPPKIGLRRIRLKPARMLRAARVSHTKQVPTCKENINKSMKTATFSCPHISHFSFLYSQSSQEPPRKTNSPTLAQDAFPPRRPCRFGHHSLCPISHGGCRCKTLRHPIALITITDILKRYPLLLQ